MSKRKGRVLIAGGGIGGLAAAIALARRGIEAEVLERSGFAEEAGAGIQLGPNATRALATLGVLDAIEPRAFRPEAIWIFDGLSGRKLTSVLLGSSAEQRYGAPYLTLRRADLHAGLLSACKQSSTVQLQSGFEVAGVEEQAGTVSVRSLAGTSIKGSSLIGADGLWSTVRKLIAPHAHLRFAGSTASRTLLPLAELPSPFDAPVVGLWLGPGAHLVHYPVRGRKELNLVAVTAGGSDSQGWDRIGEAAVLLSRFTRWSKDSKSLLEQASGWQSWSLYRLDHFGHWSAGRVALLGDAAHPVLPFLAQGAALAIEDAIALADSLATCPDDALRAFRDYETQRQTRVARVQHISRRLGKIYQLRGLLRVARNLVLKTRDRAHALERFDWLYGETTVR